MWQFAHDKFLYTVETFRGSETIIWARAQVALGAAWMALSAADLTPIIVNPKYVAYWTIFNGFVSEMLRRNREEWKDDDKGRTK
jgi:hypothetical protein